MSQNQYPSLQEEVENIIAKGTMDVMLDCYEALSIPTHADKQEITEAYERLIARLDSALQIPAKWL